MTDLVTPPPTSLVNLNSCDIEETSEISDTNDSDSDFMADDFATSTDSSDLDSDEGYDHHSL